MTDMTPEQQAEQRMTDSAFQEVASRANYTGARQGAGRWCWLAAPSGRLGILWTDDGEGLGFLPVDVTRNPSGATFVPTIMGGLQSAKALGVPASTVFDAWAARASQALWAETVDVTTDLSSLNA